MFKFPFTNFHELNLDWILSVVKEAKEVFENGRSDIDNAVETAEEAKTIAEQAAQAMIGDGAVTTAKLADNAVTSDKILDGSITVTKIANEAVTNSKIVDNAITTPKIADDAVTIEKLASGVLHRPNILDNWYFVGGGSQLGYGVFPVNQRGQTNYIGNVSGFDRWKNAGAGNVLLETDGVTCSGSDSAPLMLVQVLTTPLPVDSIKTFSILDADGNLYTTSGASIWVTDAPFGGYRIEASGSRVVIVVSANSSLKIVAVKVELGSKQTLAHQENDAWVLNELPDYGTELAKCQRVFERIKGSVYTIGSGFIQSSTSSRVNIPTKVTMPNATVTVSGTIYTAWAGHSGSLATPSTTVSETSFYGGNALLVMGGMTDLSIGQGCFMQIRDSSSFIDISAEL